MHSFPNKVVFETGGSRGIGRAVAVKFAGLGADAAITCKRRIDPNYFGYKSIRFYQCDTADSSAWLK